MRTAEIRISDGDFAGCLKDMRLWLDEHRYEPSTFTYFDVGPGVMVRVFFSVDDEAEAFAQKFGGSLTEKHGAPICSSAFIEPLVGVPRTKMAEAAQRRPGQFAGG